MASVFNDILARDKVPNIGDVVGVAKKGVSTVLEGVSQPSNGIAGYGHGKAPDHSPGKPPDKAPVNGKDKEHDKEPVKGHDKDKDKEPVKGHDKDKDKEPVKGHDKDKDKDKEPVKGHDKDKDKEPVKGHDKDKDKESVKGHDKDKDKEPVKGHDKDKDKEPVKGHDKDKDKEPVKGHDKDKDKEPVKGHDKDHGKDHDKDKDHGKDHDKDKDHDKGPDHGHGKFDKFTVELKDADGTATFVTEFGNIPAKWEAEGEAVARRHGDKLTVNLTGELLLTAPGGREFSITPSDLQRLSDNGKLTLDDIREAAAPLLDYLEARGIDATGASLKGETLTFAFDISDAASLPPDMSLTEAFTTNATIDLTVVAQVMKNLVVDLITGEGAMDLGTDFPIGQLVQEVIVDGGGTVNYGPISIDAEGTTTFDASTSTTEVDAEIVVDAGDSSLPGWVVTLGSGDDSIGLRVESDDGVIESGVSTNRQIDLGAGDNTLYLDGGLGVTVEAEKGDNWIQFTEKVSNLVDVGSETGIRASVLNVRDFSTGDKLAFGQHAAGADPRELTGPVLRGELVDVTMETGATLEAKLETAAENVDVNDWTTFQHSDDTFVFVQNGTAELETGDGLIQLVGYTGALNNSNFILPAA